MNMAIRAIVLFATVALIAPLLSFDLLRAEPQNAAKQRPASPAASHESVRVVDAVIASVDGRPVTLLDLNKRLTGPKVVTLSEVAADQRARTALQGIIGEYLIESEADMRGLKVSEDEVSGWFNEVAARNRLSPEQFAERLQAENLSVSEYKQQLKLEILRAKLVNSIRKSPVSVSDADVESYIKKQREDSPAGNKVLLKQVFISTSARTVEEALSRAAEVTRKLGGGEPFDAVYAVYSDDKSRDSNGSLGILNESELSRPIFDAILSLKDGEPSEPVFFNEGYTVFLLDKRFEPAADSEEVERDDYFNEIRKQLIREKQESKVQNFFTTELEKRHLVDRKF